MSRRAAAILWVTLVVCAVLYTHQQAALTLMRYQVEADTQHLVDRIDRYAHIRYNVLVLKAPTEIANRMAALNLDLEPPREISKAPQVQALPADGAAANSGWAGSLIPRVIAHVRAGFSATAEATTQ